MSSRKRKFSPEVRCMKPMPPQLRVGQRPPPFSKSNPPNRSRNSPPNKNPKGTTCNGFQAIGLGMKSEKILFGLVDSGAFPPRNGLGFPELGARPRTVGNGLGASGHPRAKRKQSYNICRNPLPRSMSKVLRPQHPVRSTFMFQGIGTTEINMFGDPAFGLRSSLIGFGFLRIIGGPLWDIFLSKVIGIIP